MKKNILSLVVVAVILSAQLFSQVNNTAISPAKNAINKLPGKGILITIPPNRTCGTMEADAELRAKYPDLGTLEDFENWLQGEIAKQKANPNSKTPPVYNIPTIVHVIHNGEAVGTGRNISQAQVNSQFDVLNEDFRRTNADANNTPNAFKPVAADIEITFCPAKIDPNGNTLTEPGINRISRSSKGWTAPPYSQSYIDNTIKPNSYWDPTKYFNIWVLDLSNSLLGYAQFPSNSGLSGLNANGGAASTDGCVVLYTAFGRVGNVQSPYNRGRTATHEVGHWLGLRHIWGDGTCATDYCNDTPPHSTSNYGCPSFPRNTSCSGQGSNGEMFMNYMDYTNDACMNIFTADQKTRMRTVMVNSIRRKELPSSTVCNTNTNVPPTCAFTASATTITVGNTISYTDQSSGATGWNWTFQGGTPGTSTQQNPSNITYNTIGTFNTTLIASNTFGTCTLTQVINVVASQGCDTLRFPFPGTQTVYTGGNGYVCGWNTTYKDISKAEFYTNFSPYTHVTGGLFYIFKAKKGATGNPSVNFTVWNNNGAGGSPGTKLATVNVSLATLASTVQPGGSIIQIQFPSPVAVSGSFYFGLEMLGFGNNDSLGVVSNTNGDSNPNTAWEQWSDNNWYAFNDGNSWGISISQYMLPFVTDLPPNSNPTANTTSACVGSVINFNSSSSVNATSYNWTFQGGTPATSTAAAPSVTYNTAGTYKAYLKANGSCQGTDTDSLTITINPNPSVNTTKNNVTCNGGNNGSATATPSAGTTPYTYSWSNGQTGSTATGLTAGNYIVTVTDSKGCQGTATVAITQPSAITLTMNSTPASCGGNDGSASVSATGGTTGYTYTWSNGATTTSITGLSAGTYTVTVTDANNCTKTGTATVSSSGGSSVTVTTTSVQPSCNGGSNGTATASATGGTAPYTYLWSSSAGSQTTQTATGLAAGSYSVTVTENSGCTGAQTVTVTEPSSIVVSTSTNNTTCGQNNGSATVTASGGTSPFTYLWSDGQTSLTATGLAAANYSVTVTDFNNCTNTGAATINSSNGPTATISSNNISCNGLNNGTASVSVSGGTSPYSYSWSNGSTSQSITGLSSGTYSVTITDNIGCTTNSSVTISEPPALSSSASSTNASCSGNDGTATVTANGGTTPYSYSWSNGKTTANITGLGAGTYTVTVTDSKGCTSTSSVTITQPSAINLSSNSTQATCGSPDGTASVTASGGASPYTYLWNDPSSQTTSTATGLLPGSYTVTVTDNIGCNATQTVNVSNQVPNANISSANVSCNGGSNGSASVSASGGTTPYSFSWSNGSTSSSVAGLQAGTYSVTVTDNNGCKNIQSVNITQPQPLSISSTVNNISCNGLSDGSADINVSGATSPYTYIWNTSNTTKTITGLSSGTYYATITDQNGCKDSINILISEPSSIFVSTMASSAVCNGTATGSANASASGGASPYTYLWSNGQTNATATGLPAGNYVVTATDNNGCKKTASVNVSQPSAITYSTSSFNATCGTADGSAAVNNVSGGAGSYSYQWSNGQTTSTATGLNAGSYGITVTDAAGCTKSSSVSVGNIGGPSVSLNFSQISCNGSADGSATANPSGGTSPYTYSWSNGATTSAISNLGPGTYNVSVTDNIGCVASSSISLSQPSAITPSSTFNNPTSAGICNGSAQAGASGGTSPYTYLWSNGKTTASITGLCAGTYCFTVTDDNNCKSTGNCVTITDPACNIGLSPTSSNASCGNSNGSATVTASGGSTPYSYAWSNGQTSQTATGLAAGSYDVTVTDAVNCSQSMSITVSGTPGFTLSTTTENSTCSQPNGTATVSSNGGVSPYTYLWNDNNSQTTVTASGLDAGSYSVTVTDAANCSVVTQATINNTGGFTFTSSSTNANCNNADGTATVNVTGGTQPISYQWTNNVSVSSSATGLVTGIYSVTITDGTGCTDSASFNITTTTGTTVSSTYSNENCNMDNGSISISATGTNSVFIYQWSSNVGIQSGSSVTGLSAGTYSYTVTDVQNCSISETITIIDINNLAAQMSTGADNCSQKTGSATVTPVGGTSPYSYLWNDTYTQTSSTATGLAAGVYSVEITDSIGCKVTTTALVSKTGPTVKATVTDVTCSIISNGAVDLQISGGVSPYSVNWSNDFNTEDISNLAEGNYIYTVSDAGGCTITDTAKVKSAGEECINIPSGFTPNGDGTNDTWILRGIENFPNAIVEIYNRWGELLYQSGGYAAEPWNGTRNGKELPAAAYYYVISLNSKDKTFNGSVTIVR